jgi:hypothetical protein
VTVRLWEILAGTGEQKLADAIAQEEFRDLNSYWRGYIIDAGSGERRFIELTKVMFINARRSDGSELIEGIGNPDLNLAYLEDPGEIERTSLAKFAWEMCCAAVKQADARTPNWLKAAKRAYNYFSTIGDTAHMAALEPVFSRPEARVQQYAVVISALVETLNERSPRTRILTVSEARAQVEQVAVVVERHLPDVGAGAEIATRLRKDAERLRPRNARGHLARDDDLAEDFSKQASAIGKQVSDGVKSQVQPVIEGAVRPVCPNKAKCERTR